MSEPIKTVIDAKEYSKLQAENQRLRELLQFYQWFEDDSGKWCIECGQFPENCNPQNCKLANLIALWKSTD